MVSCVERRLAANGVQVVAMEALAHGLFGKLVGYRTA
jgi:hypothetical protein